MSRVLTPEELQEWSQDTLIEAVLSFQAFCNTTSDALDKISEVIGKTVFETARIATFPLFKVEGTE